MKLVALFSFLFFALAVSAAKLSINRDGAETLPTTDGAICLDIKCMCDEMNEDIASDREESGYVYVYEITKAYFESVLHEEECSLLEYGGCKPQSSLPELSFVRERYETPSFNFYTSYCIA